MFFGIFRELCNHHHNLISEHVCPPPEKPCTYWQSLPISPNSLPQPYATTNLLSVSMDLPVLDISYRIIQYVVLCD